MSHLFFIAEHLDFLFLLTLAMVFVVCPYYYQYSTKHSYYHISIEYISVLCVVLVVGEATCICRLNIYVHPFRQA